MRFDPDDARIWFDAKSLFAGLKLLRGRDPKQDDQDKVAHVDL